MLEHYKPIPGIDSPILRTCRLVSGLLWSQSSFIFRISSLGLLPRSEVQRRYSGLLQSDSRSDLWSCQIYIEALPILYGLNTFHFSSAQCIRHFQNHGLSTFPLGTFGSFLDMFLEAISKILRLMMC